MVLEVVLIFLSFFMFWRMKMKTLVLMSLLLCLAACSPISPDTSDDGAHERTGDIAQGKTLALPYPSLQDWQLGQEVNGFTLQEKTFGEDALSFVLEGKKTLRGKLSYDGDFLEGFYFIPEDETTLEIKIENLGKEWEDLGGLDYAPHLFEGEVNAEAFLDEASKDQCFRGAELAVEIDLTQIEHVGYYHSSFSQTLEISDLRVLNG